MFDGRGRSVSIHYPLLSWFRPFVFSWRETATDTPGATAGLPSSAGGRRSTA